MITSLTLVHFIHLNAHVGSLHFLDNVNQMVVQLDVEHHYLPFTRR